MVKIREERSQRRVAWLSLAVAGAAAFITLLTWWVWPRETPQLAVQRDVTDVVLAWVCPAGHDFAARGKAGSRTCPSCGASADVLLTYRCPKHGEFDVLVRYHRDPQGAIRLSELRGSGGTWRSAGDAVCCRTCGTRVSTVRRAVVPLSEARAGGR